MADGLLDRTMTGRSHLIGFEVRIGHQATTTPTMRGGLTGYKPPRPDRPFTRLSACAKAYRGEQEKGGNRA
jgi:hypothetical protein